MSSLLVIVCQREGKGAHKLGRKYQSYQSINLSNTMPQGQVNFKVHGASGSYAPDSLFEFKGAQALDIRLRVFYVLVWLCVWFCTFQR